jgi:hypothetical protein
MNSVFEKALRSGRKTYFTVFWGQFKLVRDSVADIAYTYLAS